MKWAYVEDFTDWSKQQHTQIVILKDDVDLWDVNDYLISTNYERQHHKEDLNNKTICILDINEHTFIDDELNETYIKNQIRLKKLNNL